MKPIVQKKLLDLVLETDSSKISFMPASPNFKDNNHVPKDPSVSQPEVLICPEVPPHNNTEIPPVPNTLELEQEERMEIEKMGHLYNLTSDQLARFYEIKEAQYSRRRENLYKFCHLVRQIYDPGMKNPMIDISPHCILYDKPDGISHCSIAKVASTTWCRHFINLAGVDPEGIIEQFYVKHLWPLPTDVPVEQAMGETLSFVIVRNPLSRLASVYYEKFLDSNINPKLIQKSIELAGRERPSSRNESIESPEDDPFFPSPTEFLNFIINDFEKVRTEDLNYHWRPQHGSCPFCRFNFSVYSKMEDLHEDTAFVVQKANLTSKIKPELHKNLSQSGGKGSSKEHRFWSRVHGKMILDIFNLYYLDNYLWDYTLEAYLHSLDLEYKLNEVTS